MKGLTEHLRGQSISLAVAFVALVFAMTGGAVAGSVITGKQIKDGSINSSDLKNGAVRSADIANGQVQSKDIGRGQVRAASIGGDQITAAAIAPNQVTSSEIAPGQVQAPDIGAGQVGTDQIANGQVTSVDIGAGEVTPQDVSMPAPVQFQRPAGQPASVDINTAAYALVATMGTYTKSDGESSIDVTWTGTARAGETHACVFQLRIDGQAPRGAGEVFAGPGAPTSISATALFESLPPGPHNVEIWARFPNYGSNPGPSFNCTVGPDSADIAQTVVVTEKVI